MNAITELSRTMRCIKEHRSAVKGLRVYHMRELTHHRATDLGVLSEGGLLGQRQRTFLFTLSPLKKQIHSVHIPSKHSVWFVMA